MTLNPNPQHCPCLHFSYITCRVIAVQAASVQVSSFFSPPQTQAGSASLFQTLRNPSRMLPFCATKSTHCPLLSLLVGWLPQTQSSPLAKSLWQVWAAQVPLGVCPDSSPACPIAPPRGASRGVFRELGGNSKLTTLTTDSKINRLVSKVSSAFN